jgi:hypothetical protein
MRQARLTLIIAVVEIGLSFNSFGLDLVDLCM